MRPNPTTIGLFILGGLVLAIAALLAFGAAGWFESRQQAVAYFRGSVQGLSVGALVEFRGVPVGKVEAIKLEIDARDLTAIIPVFIEYDPHAWRYIGGPERRPISVEDAVAKGLRAELVPQSFLTGQMLVELDMRPDTPALLARPGNSEPPEIPTVKSDIEQLKDVLTSLPLRDIAASLDRATRGLDRLLASPDLPEILKNLNALAAKGASFTGNLDQDRVKLAADLHNALAALEKAGTGLQGVSTDARQVLKTMDQVTATDLRKTLRSAEATLQQMQTAFGEAANMLAPESPDRVEISRILRLTSNALQSLRDFASELERKPNAVLFGR
jgi:paraquat-inducible protein B